MATELEAEQEFVDRAYARPRRHAGRRQLDARGGARPGPGRHLPVADRARHRRPHQPGPARPARHRRPGPVLRPDRPAGRRPAPGGGETFHIGRLAISGDDHEPLVVDWRAPVAEPFYRATGRDPLGLARRRHLAVQGRTVVRRRGRALRPAGAVRRAPRAPTERPARDGGGELIEEGLALGGPAALLAALGRARTGHMSDIVATIQREQDEIIRVAADRGAGRPGRPGHRQDGGGPAPGRLPPLHPPVPARAPGRPGGRPQPALPPLHRAGAARRWARPG